LSLTPLIISAWRIGGFVYGNTASNSMAGSTELFLMASTSLVPKSCFQQVLPLDIRTHHLLSATTGLLESIPWRPHTKYTTLIFPTLIPCAHTTCKTSTSFFPLLITTPHFSGRALSTQHSKTRQQGFLAHCYDLSTQRQHFPFLIRNIEKRPNFLLESEDSICILAD
jgi:hypothetical protein